MGELFMGRKLKIDLQTNLNREPNWGQFERMNENQKLVKYNNIIEAPNAFTMGRINVEDALSYIRREN